MPAVNQGEVAITLDGEEVVLRCTFRAAKEVNAYFGGTTEAFRRIVNGDQGAYAFIIAVGSGQKRSAAGGIEEKVYATGLGDLSGPLTDYIVYLQNGGREPATQEEAVKTGEG